MRDTKAQLVKVIVTENVEGKGTQESPVRIMKRYWTLDGKLLSEQIYHGDVETVTKYPDRKEKD